MTRLGSNLLVHGDATGDTLPTTTVIIVVGRLTEETAAVGSPRSTGLQGGEPVLAGFESETIAETGYGGKLNLLARKMRQQGRKREPHKGDEQQTGQREEQ